jgi:hypothetical protein
LYIIWFYGIEILLHTWCIDDTINPVALSRCQYHWLNLASKSWSLVWLYWKTIYLNNTHEYYIKIVYKRISIYFTPKSNELFILRSISFRLMIHDACVFESWQYFAKTIADRVKINERRHSSNRVSICLFWPLRILSYLVLSRTAVLESLQEFQESVSGIQYCTNTLQNRF